MLPRKLKVLCWIVGCVLVAFVASSGGDEPKAAAAGAPSLEKIVEGLQKGADSVQEKARKLLAVIEAEAGAKRIPESLAQGLRWNLRNLTFPETPEPQAALSTVAMPADEAIVSAAKAYLETARAAQAEEAELAERSDEAIKKRCAELLENAKSASDVDTVQALLERLRTLTVRQKSFFPANTLNRYLTHMRYLRDCIDVTASSDPHKVSQMLADLNPLGFGGSEASYHKRIAIVLSPFKKVAEQAQNELDAALVERKSLDDIQAALTAFADASMRYSSASFAPFGHGERDDSRVILNAYRKLFIIAGAMDVHRWFAAQTELTQARQTISQPETPAEARIRTNRQNALNAILEKWEHDIAEGKAGDARHLHEKLHAVKQPADLEAIAAELAKDQPDAEGYGAGRFSQGFAMELSAMAQAWKTAQLNPFANEDSRKNGPEDASVSGDLAELRQRIARENTSRALKAPELLQAPLQSQPVASAVNDLLGELAAKGEWRRALRIMESQTLFEPGRDGDARHFESMMAVRSYLAGQNFEQAGLWIDAAGAYRTVVATVIDGVPLKEAAERLRALGKEHPEEVKAAQAMPLQVFHEELRR